MKAALTGVTVAAVMMALDLVFLGVVARSFYDEQMGALRASSVQWPAALMFYGMYVVAVVRHAVQDGRTVQRAARAGAEMGFFAYATYELTNWAVLAGWPAALVPVDLLWGVVLTACAAAAGQWAHSRVGAVRTA